MRNLPILFLLAALSPAQDSVRRNPLPVPNLPGFQTLKCDFHMHTVFSDGEVWPETRVREAFRDGLDAIAITDHDDYHPHRETVSVDLMQPHRLAVGPAAELGILLVPGVEITKGDIHVNALFLEERNVTAGLGLLPALQAAKQRGAFLFWNHPGWRGKKIWYPEIDAAHKEGLIQGVEVANAETLESQTLPWLEEKRLTILANTDVHQLVEMEPGRHRSPVTLLFTRTRDLAGIREALTARRTLAWRHDELWGSANLLSSLFQAAVTAERLAPSGPVIFRNSSAIPFIAQAPGGEPFTIAALASTAVSLKDKEQTDLELRNLHATDSAASVKATVRIR
jgi:predicted metal-dependent phosphoesterase TrpH